MTVQVDGTPFQVEQCWNPHRDGPLFEVRDIERFARGRPSYLDKEHTSFCGYWGADRFRSVEEAEAAIATFLLAQQGG